MKIVFNIRYFIASVIFLMLSVSAFADYPIFYQRYTADPWALVYNGRLYLYCSHDTYDKERGYGYFMNDITCISTDDMKNWTDHGEVFNVRDSRWGARLSWAPSVVCKDNQFYLYYGNGDRGIGVAVSNNPLGPFVDNNDRPVVDHNTPGVLPAEGAWGMWCFDPSVLVDDDGQVYMYFGGSSPGNSRIIKLKDNMREPEGSAIHPNTPGFFEASFVHKYKGKYYYSYSGHYFKTPSNIDYVVSDKPMEDFDNIGVILPNPPVNDNNNNHHSIAQFNGEWYIAYHNRQLAHDNGEQDVKAREYMRSVCIDRLEHNPDGTIREVVITKDGLNQLKNINPYVRNEAETMAKSKGVNTCAIEGYNRAVNNIGNGDFIQISGVDFGTTGAGVFTANVASNSSGGSIELRIDAPNGTQIGTLPVSYTGGTEVWQPKSTHINGVTGIHELYLVFKGSELENELFNVDFWKFGTGASY
jgi:arabinoxylan arabinofuranohydrolase